MGTVPPDSGEARKRLPLAYSRQTLMTEIASLAPSTPRLAAGGAAASAPVPAASVAPVPAAPQPADEAVPPDAPQPAEQSKRALQAQIDRVLADTQTSLRFRVDEESEQVVVSVLDRRGEVILQVPNETALTLARRLASGGSLVEAKA
jgi:flagellar protein FlaG